MRRWVSLLLVAAAGLGGACDGSNGGPDESTFSGGCADALDNDGDGLFDCSDPGCVGQPVCEPPVDGGAPGGGVFTFPPRDFICDMQMPPCDTTLSSRSDEERTVAVNEDFPTTTFTFLISEIVIPETTDRSAGFNLDGRSSVGIARPGRCEDSIEDVPSTTDPMHVGVDNTTARFVPTVESLLDDMLCPRGRVGCVNDSTQEAINSGNRLLLIEVSAVDSLSDDPSVSVRVFKALGTPILDGSGLPRADQSFEAARVVAGPAPGDIFQGRLRVLLPSFEHALVGPFDAALGRTELRADITETELRNGAIGGSTDRTEIEDAVLTFAPGLEESIVRAAFDSAADITSGDGTVCDRLSIGVTFSGVGATIL